MKFLLIYFLLFMIPNVFCINSWLKSKLSSKTHIKNKIFHGDPEVEGQYF